MSTVPALQFDVTSGIPVNAAVRHNFIVGPVCARRHLHELTDGRFRKMNVRRLMQYSLNETASVSYGRTRPTRVRCGSASSLNVEGNGRSFLLSAAMGAHAQGVPAPHPIRSVSTHKVNFCLPSACRLQPMPAQSDDAFASFQLFSLWSRLNSATLWRILISQSLRKTAWTKIFLRLPFNERRKRHS